MATICRDAVVQWNGRVLILAHVKELLEQTADKLRAVCPDVDFGIYSAGLKRRDTNNPIIVAGIQSVYRRACELDAFDLVMVDEAHLIPLDGDGMYRQFLADAQVVNPNLRVIGFTATPFRLKSGSICTPDGFLNHVCYEVGVRELIRDGFLCPLVTKAGRSKADTTDLHVRGGEFVADEVESLMDQESLVEAACSEIVEYTADRKACLIFSSGVQHGQHIVETLHRDHGIECGFVTGETLDLRTGRNTRRGSRPASSSTCATSTCSQPASMRRTSTASPCCVRRCRLGSTTRWWDVDFACTRVKRTASCSTLAATCCGMGQSIRSGLRSTKAAMARLQPKNVPSAKR